MATKQVRKKAGAGMAPARVQPIAFAMLALAVVALGAWAITWFKGEAPGFANEPVVSAATAGKRIDMTDLPAPAASGGKIRLSLAAIAEKRLVWFAYGRKKTPVLAYVAPSGQVVTAISLCEPCRSDRFHIEGEELVCNACGTRWALEDLRGLAGGCPEYPPARLRNEIAGDTVTIDERDITAWQPRV